MKSITLQGANARGVLGGAEVVAAGKSPTATGLCCWFCLLSSSKSRLICFCC